MAEERVLLYKALVRDVLSENRDILDISQIYMGTQRHVDAHPILKSLEIGDDFSIYLDDRPDEEVLGALGALLVTILDFVSLFLGSGDAESRVVAVARSFVAEHRDEFEGLGLTEHLPQFMGEEGVEPGERAEEPVLHTGIPGLDDLMGGGVPKSSALILQGPEGFEKTLIATRMMASGLESGASCLVLLCMESPEEFRRRLRPYGVDVAAHEEEGRLVIIDWYSHKSERVVNVEPHGSVYKTSQDLTNVGIALDMALAKLPEEGERLAVLDITSALKVFDFTTAYNFLRELRAKLRKSRTTSLFTLEKGMHKTEAIYNLHEIFDGVIDLKRYEEDHQVSREVGVMALSGAFHSTRYRALLVISGDDAQDGIRFGDEQDTIVCTLPPPLMEAREAAGGGVLSQFMAYAPPGPLSFVLEGERREKDMLTNTFIREGLEKGESVLVMLSTISPKEFEKHLRGAGVDPVKVAEEGRLKVVDWYSWKNERIVGVDIEGHIIKSSQDLTNLGMALNSATESMGTKRPMRAVVDVLSSALQSQDFEPVYGFAQSVRAVLHKREALSLFLVERMMHDADVLASLRCIFDGIMSIDRRSDREGESVAVGFNPTRFPDSISGPVPLSTSGEGIALGDVIRASRKTLETSKHLGKIREIEDRIEARRKRLREEDREQEGLKKALAELNELRENIELRSELDSLSRRLTDKETTLEEREKAVIFVEKGLKDREDAIASREKDVEARVETGIEDRLKTRTRELEKEDAEKKKRLKAEMEGMKRALEQDMQKREKELDALEKKLQKREKEMEKRVRDLEKERNKNDKRAKAFQKEIERVKKEKEGLKVFKEMETDLRRTLKNLDGLLGKLPDDVVAQFAASDEFKLYERLLKYYGV